MAFVQVIKVQLKVYDEYCIHHDFSDSVLDNEFKGAKSVRLVADPFGEEDPFFIVKTMRGNFAKYGCDFDPEFKAQFKSFALNTSSEESLDEIKRHARKVFPKLAGWPERVILLSRAI